VAPRGPSRAMRECLVFAVCNGYSPCACVMKTEPVRILFVHHNSDMYGSSRCLLHLLANLDRNRVTPLVALAEDGSLREAIGKLDIEVFIHPSLSVITRPVFESWRLLPFLLKIPLAAWQLRTLIRRWQIQLVHTNIGVAVSSGLAAWLAGVPHVWHMREWFQEFGALWPVYSRYILWLSDAVVCMSSAVAGQFPRSPKVVVIHDGLDVAGFAISKRELREDFRARYQLGNAFVVGCVGRIKLVRKGQEVLIKAAALLRDRGRRAKFVLVGAPSPGNEEHLAVIKKLVSDLKLSGDVIFAGEMVDPRPAYAAMDVAVLTSAQPEPWGLVVLEAMCMRVPVIATNIGGPVEMITDGQTGFLVPPADPNALADRIELLMTDPELRTRLVEIGPEHVRENFPVQNTARQMETVFINILSKALSVPRARN